MTPRLRKLFRFLLPALFLLAVLSWFVADACLIDRASLAFGRSTLPPDTLSGLPEPRFFTSPDSYVWLAHVRDMLLSGDWRIRHTHMDNAPYGRPMHWSHLLIWEMAAHARLLQRFRPGIFLSPAVEIAGRCAMPLFGVLFIVPLYCAFLRKLGFLPAAFFIVFLMVSPLFLPTFTPLAPDHHVFQFCFSLVVVVALSFGGWGYVAPVEGQPATTAGCVRPFWLRLLSPPSYPSARRWFFLAGVAHACLLWIGASVWLVVHAALSLAALAALAPPSSGCHPAPRLWLSFLSTSLPLSIAFYLLEYAPRFPGMRLEVNHPLYWLFLLGTVLVLHAAASSIAICPPLQPPQKTREKPSPRHSLLNFLLATARSPRILVPFVLGILLASLLPIALLFGPSSWHALHDPFLKRLHARCIVEFKPWLPIVLKSPSALFLSLRFFLIFLFAVPLLAFSPFPRIDPGARRILRPHAVLLLAFLALTLFQVRWSTLLFALLVLPSLLVLFLLFGILPGRYGHRSPWPRRIGGALLVLFALDAAWGAVRDTRELLLALRYKTPVGGWMDCDQVKRASLRLAAASSGQSWVFAGNPSDAPAFYWFGGIPSIASYYWENADGWHAEASLLAAPPGAIPPDLLAEARARGLSHVLVASNSHDPCIAHYLASGTYNPAFAVRHTLHGVLASHAASVNPGQVPPPFVLDATLTAALSKTNFYRAFRVGPDIVFPNHLSWSAFAFSPAPAPESPSVAPNP